MGDDVGLVLDDPLDNFTFLKLHRFGDGGGEIDVILVRALFAADELDFGWVSRG